MFQCRNFCQAALKSLGAAEFRLKKCFDQFPGERMANHKTAKADYVHIVVLNPLMSRKSFMNQTRTYTCYFVRGNARPHATAANGYAASHLAAGNCTSQRYNKIRIIVIRLRLAITKFGHFATGLAQPLNEIFL